MVGQKLAAICGGAGGSFCRRLRRWLSWRRRCRDLRNQSSLRPNCACRYFHRLTSDRQPDLRQLHLQLRALVCRRSGHIGKHIEFSGIVMPSSYLTLSIAQGSRARWFNTDRWNSVFDWTTRLTLASVFMLLLFGNVSWILHAATDPSRPASYH